MNYINAPLNSTVKGSGLSFNQKEAVYYIENFFKNYAKDRKALLNSLENNYDKSEDKEAEKLYYYMYSNMTIRDYIAFKINGFMNENK